MNLKEFEQIYKTDIASIYIEHQKNFDIGGIHGCLHISRSLIICRALHNKLKAVGCEVDIDKISFAVAWHDSGRKGNLNDYWESVSKENCYYWLSLMGYEHDYSEYVSNMILKKCPKKDYNFFCVYDTDCLEIIRPSTGIGVFNFKQSYLRCNHILPDYTEFINEIIPFITETENIKENFKDENSLSNLMGYIHANKNIFPTLYDATIT